MFFTSITNSEEWRASICLCMHNVYTVIFNPLHRVVTPEDVIVALVTYIKLLKVSVHNLQHWLPSAVGHVTLRCKPWFHGPSLGGTLHVHGLWERCLYSVFPDLHGQGSLAQHKCGWSWSISSYVTLIFYSLDWTSSAAKCLCWSFIVLNIICSQMTPYMALWGFFKICNFVLLVVAAA